MGCFSYNLYRLFLTTHSFSLTLFTLDFRLFFILLQINQTTTTFANDEVKDDDHGAFTPEMLKLSQATCIATFLECVTDKNTGLPLFSEFFWFAYKVSGVMCSGSECEYCWSVEGWIHSQRRNRLDQKLVEKLVPAHTNLVMRESLDDALRNLLPWDIELVIDEPVSSMNKESNRKFKCGLLLLKPF